MKTFVTRLLAVAIIMTCSGCHSYESMAQSQIDKIAEELQHMDKVEKSFVKKRNRHGNLVKSIQSFSFTDRKYARKLIDAFEEEEKNADKSAISKSNGNMSYAYTFYGKDKKTLYCLSVSGSCVNLSIIYKNTDD